MKHIPLRPNRFAGLQGFCHRLFFILFLIQFGLVWAGLLLGEPIFGAARWPEGVLLVLCAATTLASLARQLPAQNVMLASVIIVILTAAVEALGAAEGVPFGPHSYTKAIGQELFHPLPWTIPVLWLVAILNARGVARLILRRWRRKQNYGWWLIGLSGVLVVLFDFCLQPFATELRRYWLWNNSHTTLLWYSTPWVNFLGRATTTLLILAFVTPALIQKRPGPPAPPEWHPLLIWMLMELLFATGVVKIGLKPATIAIVAINVMILGLAVGGYKRAQDSSAAGNP